MRVTRVWMLTVIGLFAGGAGAAGVGRAEGPWRGVPSRAEQGEAPSDAGLRDGRVCRPTRYILVGECAGQRIGGVATVSPALVERALASGQTHVTFAWRSDDPADWKGSDLLYKRITEAGAHAVVRPLGVGGPIVSCGSLPTAPATGCAEGTRRTQKQGSEEAACGGGADDGKPVRESLRRKYARIIERYPDAKTVRLDLDRPDAAAVGDVADVVRGLGCRLMLHSGTDSPTFWKACRGAIDVASVVLPETPPGDGARQRRLDEQLGRLREALGPGVLVIGRPVTRPRAGGPTGHVRKARDWKPTILRMAAAGYRGVDIPATPPLTAEVSLYVGRATRALCTFEELFWHGTRNDDLASASLGDGNVLVLTRASERLVLLFNEADRKRTVELANHELGPRARTRYVAQTYEVRRPASHPNKMFVTVPAHDVAVVHVRPRG